MAKPVKGIKKAYSATDFFLEDLPRTLFPLTTNKVLVELGAEDLLAHAEMIVAGGGNFLPQRRVYANKDELHLRRTVKLDAVAEYYLYHLVHKNRQKFRKPHRDSRRHYGYRFELGRPVSPSKSYADFKSAVASGIFYAEEFTYFDISAYFNGLYHHDLHAWFAALGPDDSADVVAFSKFFREINAGRSLDCLPQGLYPAKMIGNDFLRFIEDSSTVRAERIVRFMDDVYLFGDDLNGLKADFAEVQRLLGLKGLSVNASKTRNAGTPQTDEADGQLSELKKRLLKRRRHLIVSHYDEDEIGDDDGTSDLDEDEIEFILDLLNVGDLSEDDAELILVVMRDHVARIEQHLGLFAKGFPHLAKNFYGLCSDASDKDSVARIVLQVASEGDHIGEYQLFWFGMMLEAYLLDTACAPDIINALYRHESATDISKAKILEIADLRYGLPEMRETYLREGRSDWLAWSSAVGSRAMDKQARNYLLDYFKNGSAMNRLIASILQKA
ncbi:antiviral reverse transcriptase Drt5 [Rhizorhabdus argentea]|uniref:antiviral reverse transcriptase Drt5 n=1 Tax=Rhizorhabdus argentea TaxID=1387174 RepID=UPI0030EC4132